MQAYTGRMNRSRTALHGIPSPLKIRRADTRRNLQASEQAETTQGSQATPLLPLHFQSGVHVVKSGRILPLLFDFSLRDTAMALAFGTLTIALCSSASTQCLEMTL